MSFIPQTQIVQLGRPARIVPSVIAGAVGGAESLLDGLVSYWNMDELSGTRRDSAGTNHLTVVNSVSGATDIKKLGSAAARFPADPGSILTCASNSTLVMAGRSFSLWGWVYLDESTVEHAFISKWNSSTNSREFILGYDTGSSPSNRYFYFVTNPTGLSGAEQLVQATSFGTPVNNVFYFIVAWYDASNGTNNIQINNGAIDSIPSSGVFGGTADLVLGDIQNPGFVNFYGRLDEAGLSRRVLTASERTRLFNSNIGRTYPFA